MVYTPVNVLREIALDDARQQHADDANTGAGHEAAQEYPGRPKRAAHHNAQGQGEENAENHPLTAKTPRQDRRQRRKQAQTQHRQGGQQARLRRAQAQALGNQAEYRGHARQRRAQVQRHQHQAQQQQPGPAQQHRLLLNLLVIGFGVDQQFVEFPLAGGGATGDGFSHGLLWVRIR